MNDATSAATLGVVKRSVGRRAELRARAYGLQLRAPTQEGDDVKHVDRVKERIERRRSPRAVLPVVHQSATVVPPAASVDGSSVRFACGLTTVPERLGGLFEASLASVRRAGFEPRVFVDGCEDASLYTAFGTPLTLRWPRVRTMGNWALGIAELYLRDPRADCYVMFQDDIAVCRDLRAYLDRLLSSQRWPALGYLNLYTAHANGRRLSSRNKRGWFTSNQYGLGALALAFTRDALVTLLSQKYFVERPQDEKRGHQAIDGGILSAMKRANYKEYVHAPGFVQHKGAQSTMGHSYGETKYYVGDDVSALDYL